MRRLLVFLAIVSLLSATMSVAWAAHESTTTEKVAGIPLSGWVEDASGGCRVYFDTQSMMIPPVPPGGKVCFRVVPVVTDLAKRADLWVTTGLSLPRPYLTGTPDVGRRSREERVPVGMAALNLISYEPKADEVPQVVINMTYLDATRSSAPLVWVFGATVSYEDGKYVVRYPIRCIQDEEWAAAKCEVGAPYEAYAARQTEIERITARNAEVRARNVVKQAEYRAAFAAWEKACEAAKPRTESRKTGSRTIVRQAVIRFLQNGSLAAYNGPFAITSNGREVVRDQASNGQGSIKWWREGAEVVVKYGSHLDLSTTSFVLDADGVIEILWRSGATRPDAPRRAITSQEILSLLRSGRRAGADGVLRVLGTCAQEVEATIKAGTVEVRPVCPGERFRIASGSPAQTANWSPAAEQPAIWVTLRSGQAIALQIIQGCGNFMAGRYLPAPELLQPVLAPEDICEGFTVQADKPTKPTPPVYEEELPCPEALPRPQGAEKVEWSPEKMATSSDVSLHSLTFHPPVLWIWSQAARMIQSQSQSQVINPVTPPVTPPGTTCGDGKAPNDPAGARGLDVPVPAPHEWGAGQVPQ